jgi:hypothetical protein
MHDPSPPITNLNLNMVRYFGERNMPGVDYPDGFQGTQIPVFGPTVAKLIEDRVAGLA